MGHIGGGQAPREHLALKNEVQGTEAPKLSVPNSVDHKSRVVQESSPVGMIFHDHRPDMVSFGNSLFVMDMVSPEKVLSETESARKQESNWLGIVEQLIDLEMIPEKFEENESVDFGFTLSYTYLLIVKARNNAVRPAQGHSDQKEVPFVALNLGKPASPASLATEVKSATSTPGVKSAASVTAISSHWEQSSRNAA